MRRIRFALLAAAVGLIGVAAVWTRLAPAAATAPPVPSVAPVASASPHTGETPAASSSPVAPSAVASSPARFAAPQTLATSAALGSGPPGAAVDARGRSLVAWTGGITRRGGRVLVRRGDSRGRFGATRTLSGRPAFDPSAALAADGTAAVVWDRIVAHGERRLEVAVAPRGHGFGRVQRLVAVRANILAGQVLAAGGRLVAVWWQGVPGHGHAVRYAIAGADGRFGPARTIAASGEFGAVSATADAAGDVIAAWGTPNRGQTNQQAAVAALPAGETRFGAPQVVSADTARSLPGSLASAPELFAGPGGVAAGYGVGATKKLLLQVATAGPGGVLGAPRTAAWFGESAMPDDFVGPAVALPAGRGAVAVWTETQSRGGENETIVSGRVVAAAEQPDGTFSAPRRLSTAEEVAQGYLSALAAGTTSIALWGEGSLVRPRLRYATDVSGDGFTAPVTLATRADRGFTGSAAGDRAIVAWSTGRSVRVARLTAGAR